MSLLETINIGANAVDVHSKRIDIAAKNMANLDTPNYVRKIPILNSTDDISFSGVMNSMKQSVFSSGTIPLVQGGVSFTGIIEDPNRGEKLYKPGHPDADKNGYIYASNVSPLVEMADATLAQRAYEANLAIVTIAKAMAQRAVEIGR